MAGGGDAPGQRHRVRSGRAAAAAGSGVAGHNTVPDITASAAGGPIFGHLQSAMVMRVVKGASVLRLEERYADYLQVGFIGYQRLDIRSNDLRAAVVVKAAAS